MEEMSSLILAEGGPYEDFEIDLVQDTSFLITTEKL